MFPRHFSKTIYKNFLKFVHKKQFEQNVILKELNLINRLYSYSMFKSNLINCISKSRMLLHQCKTVSRASFGQESFVAFMNYLQ